MKFARSISIVLLVFLALTAYVGSIPMIAHPHGNQTTMLLTTLQYSPFHDFLIPGVLLFAANGVLASLVLLFAILRWRHYAVWIGFQGCVLLGWLVAECWLLRMVMWLHYFYGAIAVALIVCGALLVREKGVSAASY